MSKKPTSNKPKKTKAPKADRAVGVGHNQLSNDQRAALLMQACSQVEKKQEAIAALTADIRNIRKTAKADGISPAELNYALHLRKADPDEAVALFRQQVQIAQWLAHPIGKQASLFDADRTPLEDRAFDEGKAAGLAGESAKPPYDAVPGQKWMDGWHSGQAVLLKGIRTVAEEEPGHQKLLKGEPVEDDGGDYDDEDETAASDIPWDDNAPSRVN